MDLNDFKAKRFYHTPEGIAKGIRRIVAFTGEDAAKAIAEGERLASEIEAARKLPEADLDKALSVFKQVDTKWGYVCLLVFAK